MKRIVILGAGTAGTTMASKLRKRLSDNEWTITVCDKDNTHIYQPGLLFIPFGSLDARDIVRPRDATLPSGVNLILEPMERVDVEAKTVRFHNRETIEYDILIIATGAQINPSLTDGLRDVGWGESAFDFYTVEGATALAAKLERFEGGRLLVHIVDMPIKCPVAPLEFTFLADAYFTERGMRDKVEIVYATPLDGAFTKPRAAAALSHLLDERGITVETEVATERVDGEKRVLSTYDGREIDYDLMVSVPLHQGSDVIVASELGDAMGFVPTDPGTLKSRAHDDIFVLGDATDLPSSKAGSVAHFQSDVLIENIMAHIKGLPPPLRFDGHSNCFIETGYGKAMLIDFNYETEPLPGRYPLPGIGPFTLLEESEFNHWGKLAFKWAYWNLLVRGEDIPLDHRMVMAGKWN